MACPFFLEDFGVVALVTPAPAICPAPGCGKTPYDHPRRQGPTTALSQQQLEDASYVGAKRAHEESAVEEKSMSKLSIARAQSLASVVGLVGFVEASLPPPQLTLPSFVWKAGETELQASPRALLHLQDCLPRAGVQLGSGAFKLADVHLRSTQQPLFQRLFQEPTLGACRLKGGPDFLLVPACTAEEGLALQCRVLFELKTPAAFVESGSRGQAVGEMLGALSISNFNPLVVLTDLVAARVYWAEDTVVRVFVGGFDAALEYVSQFLSRRAGCQDPAYSVDLSADVATLLPEQRASKRARMSLSGCSGLAEQLELLGFLPPSLRLETALELVDNWAPTCPSYIC